MSIVVTSGESRASWIEDVSLSSGLKETVENSSILFLPVKNFRGKVDFAFPQGTLDLYNYLKKEIEGTGTVEICIDDERYSEIALYSRKIRFGKIIVNVVFAPLIVGLLTNYMYDQLSVKGEDNVTIAISVESECQNYEVHYDGTAEDFGTINESIKNILANCNINESTPTKEAVSEDND
ncbi:hypothetical protein [Photobacterium damselae]|uniref:Uncharacterized protein n=1 Tax=Photobacterium damselae TaxID=38293 RepID=A0A2T3QMY8_PHODM|nr:hypothetical protein [Photobacterium damselae]PSW86367.1 hypothetical protein CTN07_06730 [Photobacterium damselae]SPY29376.1 Uncharacterised protein [Photobacterium damselae]